MRGVEIPACSCMHVPTHTRNLLLWPLPVFCGPQALAARRGMAAPALVALGDHRPSREGAEASVCSGLNPGPEEGPGWAEGGSGCLRRK